MRVLLTGGAGYLGSHILLKLLGRQMNVLVLDNFCNSSTTSPRNVSKLSNCAFQTSVGDIRDSTDLVTQVGEFRPDCVIHCAGRFTRSEVTYRAKAKKMLFAIGEYKAKTIGQYISRDKCAGKRETY